MMVDDLTIDALLAGTIYLVITRRANQVHHLPDAGDGHGLQPPSAGHSSEKETGEVSSLYNAEYSIYTECCTKYLHSAINVSDGRQTILYDLPSCGPMHPKPQQKFLYTAHCTLASQPQCNAIQIRPVHAQTKIFAVSQGRYTTAL